MQFYRIWIGVLKKAPQYILPQAACPLFQPTIPYPDKPISIDFEEAIHEDKRATLLAVLHHQLDSHRNKAEARIREYLASGGPRARIVPAERGKLEKYVARMSQKIQAAERANGFEFDEPTTFGVLVAEVR